MSLFGKTVLLTGASGGLGKELALHFWEQGANLFLVSRTKNRQLLENLKNQPAQVGQRWSWLQQDLANEYATASIHQNFFAVFDKIDILINNAATQQPIGTFWETDWQEWEHCLRVNLYAPLRLMRVMIPYMLKEKCGRIINLSGGGATSSRPCFSAYAVAKTGLVRATEIIADEIGKDGGVTANCVAPGAMRTAMMDEILQCEKAPEAEKKKAEQVKQKGNGMEKVVALIDWLISDWASAVTGRLISAQWDTWEKTFDRDYVSDDLYKLRRFTVSK